MGWQDSWGKGEDYYRDQDTRLQPSHLTGVPTLKPGSAGLETAALRELLLHLQPGLYSLLDMTTFNNKYVKAEGF